MTRRKAILVVPVLICVFALFMAATAQAKSLYVIMHGAGTIEAYDIAPDGTLTLQIPHPTDTSGVGLAVDTESEYLFVTHEGDNDIELVDARTMTDAGSVTAEGADDLAGIVVDQDKAKVYTVDRETSNLYVYSWDPTGPKLTLDGGAAVDIALPSGGAYGLALDEINDKLYVSTDTNMVYYYDTGNFAASPGSIDLDDHTATGIAVDPVRGYLYTGNGFHYDEYLNQYNLSSGSEAEVHIGTGFGAVGLAVDLATGNVFCSTGRQSGSLEQNKLLAFDNALNPIGSPISGENVDKPAGMCVPGKEISYNPLNLSKDDGISEDDVVGAGANLTYTICFDNLANEFGLTGVTLVDTLPAEVSFVSATDEGVYDSETHTVTWDVGDVDGLAGQVCGQLVVQVDSATPLDTIILNYVTINSEELPLITTSESTVVGEGLEPAGILNPAGGGGSCGGCFINTASHGFPWHLF